MLLSELLRPDLIRVPLGARTREQAIAELVDVLLQQHEIALSQRAAVLSAVLSTEDTHSSGLEGGIALPRAVSDKVEDILAVMGVSREGVDFHAPDGQPARIVILVLAPKRNYAGEVRTLAGIQHLLSNAGFRQKLLAATDARQLFDLIEAEEHPAGAPIR
jgi:mannitol/fructose-specific phosphotransferase system IIA component (Ntr-type)